jgi:hypothetical protein
LAALFVAVLAALFAAVLLAPFAALLAAAPAPRPRAVARPASAAEDFDFADFAGEAFLAPAAGFLAVAIASPGWDGRAGDLADLVALAP